MMMTPQDVDDSSVRPLSGTVPSRTAPDPEPKRLGEFSSPFNITVADRVKLLEAQMRSDLAKQIGKWFFKANLFVFLLVIFCLAVDFVQYWLPLYWDKPLPSTPPARLIDQSVLQTLIGATTVQLGIMMVAIVRSLFPGGTPPR